MSKIKVVIIGKEGIGKTALVEQITLAKKFSEPYTSTQASALYHSQCIYNKKQVAVEYWDTSGAQRYHSLLPMYLRGNDVILLCYNCSDPDSFKFAKNSYEKLSAIDKTHVFLIGTRADLPNPIDSAEITEFVASNKLTERHIVTSAKTEKNIAVLLGIKLNNYFIQLLDERENLAQREHRLRQIESGDQVTEYEKRQQIKSGIRFSIWQKALFQQPKSNTPQQKLEALLQEYIKRSGWPYNRHHADLLRKFIATMKTEAVEITVDSLILKLINALTTTDTKIKDYGDLANLIRAAIDKSSDKEAIINQLALCYSTHIIKR